MELIEPNAVKQLLANANENCDLSKLIIPINANSKEATKYVINSFDIWSILLMSKINHRQIPVPNKQDFDEQEPKLKRLRKVDASPSKEKISSQEQEKPQEEKFVFTKFQYIS